MSTSVTGRRAPCGDRRSAAGDTGVTGKQNLEQGSSSDRIQRSPRVFPPTPPQVFPAARPAAARRPGNNTDRPATRPRRGEAPYLAPEIIGRQLQRETRGFQPRHGRPPAARAAPRRLCSPAGRPGRREAPHRPPHPAAGAMLGAPPGTAAAEGRAEAAPSGARCRRPCGEKEGGEKRGRPRCRLGGAGGAPRACTDKLRASPRAEPPPPLPLPTGPAPPPEPPPPPPCARREAPPGPSAAARAPPPPHRPGGPAAPRRARAPPHPGPAAAVASRRRLGPESFPLTAPWAPSYIQPPAANQRTAPASREHGPQVPRELGARARPAP